MYPEIAAEWHPTKNEKGPEEYTAYSGESVWWYLPYDDPATGHHDFEWQAVIYSRTRLQAGCPYLKGQAVWTGFNDLATLFPKLAKEWDVEKNGGLRPEQVYVRYVNKVWWRASIIDKLTGKERVLEWQQSVERRTSRGYGHSRQDNLVVPGVNSLAVTNPELAREWDPRNAVDPDHVKADSIDSVWWFIDYFDERSGKTFHLTWKARIRSRAIYGQECPYFSGRKVMPGLNDLATTHPDLAKQWHPTLNGDLQPSDVTAHSSVRKVWWLQEYDDPKTGHHEFVWSSTVYNRAILGAGCPYLSCDVWTGYNDLQTIYPRIAAQWHPTKNQTGPDQVSAFSTKMVWWIMPYDDPQYGHFDFEWQATIASRTKGGNGCPYLSGAKVWKGFNDLVTTHPDIAKQWHPTLNRKNRPEEYSAGSNEIVWWYLPYDDPKYGHFDFEWKASIYSRALRNENCPYLTGNAVWSGFNDLKTTHPELAKQWHPTKNELTPEMVSYGSKENVW